MWAGITVMYQNDKGWLCKPGLHTMVLKVLQRSAVCISEVRRWKSLLRAKTDTEQHLLLQDKSVVAAFSDVERNQPVMWFWGDVTERHTNTSKCLSSNVAGYAGPFSTLLTQYENTIAFNLCESDSCNIYVCGWGTLYCMHVGTDSISSLEALQVKLTDRYSR